MTTRRGFLGGLAGILAAGVAPAAVGSSILMPVRGIVRPLGQRGYVDWKAYQSAVILNEGWMDNMAARLGEQMAHTREVIALGVLYGVENPVAYIDTPVPGGTNRRFLPVRSRGAEHVVLIENHRRRT